MSLTCQRCGVSGARSMVRATSRYVAIDRVNKRLGWCELFIVCSDECLDALLVERAVSKVVR